MSNNSSKSNASSKDSKDTVSNERISKPSIFDKIEKRGYQPTESTNLPPPSSGSSVKKP